MEHADHVNLNRDGVGGGATWADLGSGTGTFTFAADLLRPGGTIYSADRDEAALRQQARAMERSFPDVTLHQLTADFTQPLELPQLDRVVMANSLHFEREATAVVAGIVAYFRAGVRFVLVEYDTDGGNPWVPHPLSFET